MRISTSQIFNSGVSAMQSAQSELNKTSLQLATGRRILTPSDDPSGATQSIRIQAAINETEQYQRNADLAQPRLELEEAQLDAMEISVQRARELVLTASNDTYNEIDRNYIAREIRQLRDDILAIGNTQDANGEYIFAGTASWEMPFNENEEGRVVYDGADGVGAVREVPITTTRNISIGDTGETIFMDIQNKSGFILDPQVTTTGTLDWNRESSKITDRALFEDEADKIYRIEFYDNSGSINYKVIDSAGDTLEDQPYDSATGATVEFAGRRIVLVGEAKDGDKVVSNPAQILETEVNIDPTSTLQWNSESSGIANRQLFEADADKTYRIQFYNNSGSINYRVLDSAYNLVKDSAGNEIEDQPYDSATGETIEFAGRRIVLEGAAVDGDEVISTSKDQTVSIFDTLDSVATALENSAISDPDDFAASISTALLNIDSSIENFSEVRTTVGVRLSTLDAQAGLNDERTLTLESTLSEIRDLDYAEAISRFKLQEVVLQAAQQSYVQVSRMSLFDYL